MKRYILLLLVLSSGLLFWQKEKTSSKVFENTERSKATTVLTPKRFHKSIPVRDMPPSNNTELLEGKVVPKNGVDTLSLIHI